MVIEQIDFVDVKKTAIRAGQKAGLEDLFATVERGLQIECTDHAVLAGAKRQIHNGDRGLDRGRQLAGIWPAQGAEPRTGLGRTVVGTAFYPLYLWQ